MPTCRRVYRAIGSACASSRKQQECVCAPAIYLWPSRWTNNLIANSCDTLCFRRINAGTSSAPRHGSASCKSGGLRFRSPHERARRAARLTHTHIHTNTNTHTHTHTLSLSLTISEYYSYLQVYVNKSS